MALIVSNLKPKSNLYYLLPAFGSIIGGLIAMIILRKQGRQYDKLGRNCVLLGIIASGFAIGMDYVNSTYDIPMIEDYLNPDGIPVRRGPSYLGPAAFSAECSKQNAEAT